MITNTVRKKTNDAIANSTSDWPRSSRADLMIYWATRRVADLERLIVLGTPGTIPMMLVNDLRAVTVTVSTMCLPPEQVAEQSLAVGLVSLKTPASVAQR